MPDSGKYAVCCITDRRRHSEPLRGDAQPSIIQNVCLRHYRLIGLVMTLTFDPKNLFSNVHSCDEYIWQVSLKSVH